MALLLPQERFIAGSNTQNMYDAFNITSSLISQFRFPAVLNCSVGKKKKHFLNLNFNNFSIETIAIDVA